MPAHVLTVLKSGGEYRQEHVDRLRLQLERHSPGVKLICLSDTDAADIPLVHGWPGWWSKIECFAVPGPVLYMDLDTSIIGDVTPLLHEAERREFIVLRDFNPHARDMGSGLMAWSGDMRFVFDAFAHDPVGHMARNRAGRWLGDQGFIERVTDRREYWQSILPGAVVSFKKHVLTGLATPAARVVCFHGKPRPWEVNGW